MPDSFVTSVKPLPRGDGVGRGAAGAAVRGGGGGGNQGGGGEGGGEGTPSGGGGSGRGGGGGRPRRCREVPGGCRRAARPSVHFFARGPSSGPVGTIT